jgi:hypothetical protein
MDGRNEDRLRPGSCLHAEGGRWRSVQPVSDCAPLGCGRELLHPSRAAAAREDPPNPHGEFWCVVRSQTSYHSVVAAHGLQQWASANHSDVSLDMAFARLGRREGRVQSCGKEMDSSDAVDSHLRDCETRKEKNNNCGRTLLGCS